jgi:hypothetical protein
MWPLHFVLLLAFAAQPQQAPSTPEGSYLGRLPHVSNLQLDRLHRRRISPQQLAGQNVCYFIRSYHFRRQDGLAPVPAGVTTCTPANAFRQKQVTGSPDSLYVPMVLEESGKNDREK